MFGNDGLRIAFVSFAAFGLAACQSSQSSFQGSNFSNETRTLEKQLNAEAVALGAAQGAASLAASADPTGISSFIKAPVGLAARNALARSAAARMDAQLAHDEQALYRRYGMNPDGTPSGKKPSGGD
ncbi:MULTISPECIES: hypothetical protein [unclassified Beijerinckia]|uniref:hypothetical protein n=1 Tax=unclassified Beijerinckia TaxID=2638183 RepID=UPI00089AA1DE|nr:MULTISPECIES: hypothetical protein [unclassified Beijerinckia]MDH7796016.1 hypothetical protein [Beijerinckia sp. GAS462]SEC26489.1 hypothetical protein SAMN05443249_2294 [Beijerinckia sp. 28-YEA-48]